MNYRKKPIEVAARMSDEDFITWLEVKASKYANKRRAQSGGWSECTKSLIEEFKKEWMAASVEGTEEQ